MQCFSAPQLGFGRCSLSHGELSTTPSEDMGSRDKTPGPVLVSQVCPSVPADAGPLAEELPPRGPPSSQQTHQGDGAGGDRQAHSAGRRKRQDLSWATEGACVCAYESPVVVP